LLGFRASTYWIPARMKLQIEQIAVTFDGAGSPYQALAPVSFSVPAGRFVSLIGPSGCGKSTLFNVIAGLLKPSEGRVLIDGEDVTGYIGRVGYMLQKDLLLPWRTVLDNVVLGMEIQGVPAKVSRARAMPYLQRYGLGGFEGRYPRALSGGMRQRAALLRTLLIESDVILLDEPFGALDAQTRQRMQEWLLQIWEDFGKTVVFVTHDIDEAIFLSDEIFVMGTRPGRILERIEVGLGRPRSAAAAATSRFIELKAHCLDLLDVVADDAAQRHAA
jgi:ABC-type nitrate/sulfonate/bicarbonate transport system ATPase subunit